MNNYPKLSIIIATYNSQKTITKALDSVLNQKYQDWECIIVDGASTDYTINIVKEFEKKDSRFRHISEPDKGIYDAFNKGWKLAKGEWIHYLGSDDYLTHESFTELLDSNNSNYDIVTGDVWIKKIDGTIKANLSNGFSGCHQGKIVRKSIIEKMHGFNEKYSILADLDLMIRMERAGVRILNKHTMVAYFIMDGTSQKFSGEYKRFKERSEIYKTNNVTKWPIFKSAIIHFRIILSLLYRTCTLFLSRKYFFS